MNFDRILSARPVNKSAAVVTSRSSAPMPTGSPHPRFKIDELPRVYRFRPARKTEQDLTGWQYGRLKVIGYIGPQGGGKWAPRLWLVRCVCGQYEGRRPDSIVKRRPDAMCWDCQHVHQMRRASKLDTTRDSGRGEGVG